eukprot:s2210_g4.t1
MDKVLHEVLDELEYRLGWGMWDPNNCETAEQKRRRYLDSEMCEVSDVEYWTLMHYGPPLTDDAEASEESSMENDEMVRHSAFSPELRQTMLETNQLLQTRVERLECEWDEAELAGDVDAMDVLEAQISEARGHELHIQLNPSFKTPPDTAPRLAAPGTTLAESIEEGVEFQLQGKWPDPPLLVVLVGLPGCGKTSFAQRLGPIFGGDSKMSPTSPWRRVCQDLLRSKEACVRAASSCLDQGQHDYKWWCPLDSQVCLQLG